MRVYHWCQAPPQCQYLRECSVCSIGRMYERLDRCAVFPPIANPMAHSTHSRARMEWFEKKQQLKLWNTSPLSICSCRKRMGTWEQGSHICMVGTPQKKDEVEEQEQEEMHLLRSFSKRFCSNTRNGDFGTGLAPRLNDVCVFTSRAGQPTTDECSSVNCNRYNPLARSIPTSHLAGMRATKQRRQNLSH